MKSQPKFKHFHSRKCIWKCHQQNGIYFISASSSKWTEIEKSYFLTCNVIPVLETSHIVYGGSPQANHWIQTRIHCPPEQTFQPEEWKIRKQFFFLHFYYISMIIIIRVANVKFKVQYKGFYMFGVLTKKWTLHWRPDERDGVSNHQRLNCLLRCLLRHTSKKTSKLCITVLCEGNPPAGWPADSPHKGPVTQKMFPFEFDDVIMTSNVYHVVYFDQ